MVDRTMNLLWNQKEVSLKIPTVANYVNLEKLLLKPLLLYMQNGIIMLCHWFPANALLSFVFLSSLYNF